ncbi:MAG: M13 family metallopeptidase [Alphaproteobacteria bacterium]|nr:M13 family metallopeptidase [Alphaproteobacteria bacterium]
MRKAMWLAAAAGLVLAASAALAADDASLQAPRYGAWGFDLAGRDLAVKPGDDFAAYASGKALAAMTIPPDKARWGAFGILADLSQRRVHAILEDAAASAPAVPTGEEGKIGAFYRAYMDEPRVESLGVAPLTKALAPIHAARSRAALARLMGREEAGFGEPLFNAGVEPDSGDPTRYTVSLSQSGLGLPDRDYYLLPVFAQKKAAYQAYVAKLLTLAGWPDAKARAADIVAFETQIAEASWTRADRRDPKATYNPMTREDLARLAPGFDWTGFLSSAGLGGEDRLVVREKTALPKLAALYAGTPLATLKAWAAFHVADQAAPFLPKAFVEAHFDFHGKTLTGTPQMPERWKRAADEVGGLYTGMGDAVGKIYVARYFPPSSKAQMEALVENLRQAFAARIKASDWMSEATKSAALEKLARYKIMIGYTEEWRDYSHLTIRADDLFGDALRARSANWDFEIHHLGKPVDRNQWGMTPQTVNAYNNGRLVEVVFPAAILQPPFFDPKADPAVNYGGIGAVIGHEMTHGFDDQGRQFDAMGKLRDWWTPGDDAKFQARAKAYGTEYAAYDTGLGLHINPRLTMGENIADLGGLNLAIDAYHASLNGQAAPILDGYSGDQRLFLGWAQVWESKERADAIRQQIASDPHSPDHYRAITPERNIDLWYQAFDVQPGETLYLAPADRVRIW